MSENHLPSNATECHGTSPSGTPLLSRAECNIMRGFAIIIIIINNFTHLLKGVFMDSEYQYLWKNVGRFLNNLSHPDAVLPFNIISFYCPYGVMLFIFLSGYGLTLKYEKGDGPAVTHKSFITSHYNKLFFMQLKGLALYITILSLMYPDYVFNAINMILQVFLLGNLNPYGEIMPGPYWFFGMIMEMYVIYRLVIFKRSDKVMWVLIVLSLVVMALFPPASFKMMYLRINCFLAILPFCMGVLAARHLHVRAFSLHKGKMCLLWLLLSFVLLTLTKFNFYSWLVMPVFVVATAVTFVKLASRANWLSDLLGWFGALSGVLFVVHPAVRILLLQRANTSDAPYFVTITYLIVTIGLSILLKPLFSSKKKAG